MKNKAENPCGYPTNSLLTVGELKRRLEGVKNDTPIVIRNKYVRPLDWTKEYCVFDGNCLNMGGDRILILV